MTALAQRLEAVSWETVVVSAEIFCAVSASLWMMYRRVSRDVLILGGDFSTFMALSPLIQPRGWWSLPALLAYRCLAAGFYVIVQCYDVYRTQAKCLAFYTSWNFIAQGAYFATAAKRTSTMWQQQMERPSAYAALLDETTGFLRANSMARATRRGWNRLDLVLDVCLSTSVLIGVVVWTILYPYAEKIGRPETILNWVSYCQHAINIVLLQIDFLATQHSVSIDALPLAFAWPTAYCIFTWVVHGTIMHGFWPYPFLNLDTPWAPFWYAGLLFAHVAAFVAMLYVSKLKHARHNEAEASPSADAIADEDELLEDPCSDEPLSPRASEIHAHF